VDGTVWKDSEPLKDKLILDGECYPIELPTEGMEASESEPDSDVGIDEYASGDEAEFGTLQDEDFKSKLSVYNYYSFHELYLIYLLYL